MESQQKANMEVKGPDYEKFIHTILMSEYGREVLEFEAMRKGQNAVVYHIAIAPAPPKSSNASQAEHLKRPGVVPLPASSLDAVIRLSQPRAMLNESTRVQNEIAMMMLTRQALSSYNASLVPDIYGWAPSGRGNDLGWSLIQYLPGQLLSSSFSKLSRGEQRVILGEVSLILKNIRQYNLPSSIKAYGGLTFSDNDEIITGQTVIPGGGPSATHAGLYTDFLQYQLQSADQSDVIQGWRKNSIRARIERFVNEKFLSLWEQDVFTPRLTLVHADFDIWNMLFDPKTNRITGLIDYDFGHIGSQADESFYSLSQLHFLVVPPYEDDEDIQVMRNQLLGGWKHAEIASKSKCEAVDWELALLLDEQLAQSGVERPSDIGGMDELSARYWFIQSLSPPILSMKTWRERIGPEKVEEFRQKEEAAIEQYLQRWGY